MNKKSKLKSAIIPLIIILINILIILNPRESIGAAKDGLLLWFNNVLPSLLPFMIGTHLLISLGVVKFLGVLLEPIMRPLFGVSGSGGFAFAIGLLSGYPMGAKITGELRNREEISVTEAERLISFCNNSGPLFIIGTVGVGMFGNSRLGYFLLGIHILSSISTGLLFRNYGKKDKSLNSDIIKKNHEHSKINQSFGAILGSSVSKSMETILQVGGFIIIFSVISKLLQLTGAIGVMENLLIPLGKPFGIPNEIYKGTLTGIIEMTNGLKLLSDNGVNQFSIIFSAFILSWGGFSIHAQSINFISNTGIKTSTYLLGKFVNSLFAIFYSVLVYKIFGDKILSETFEQVIHSYDPSFADKILLSTQNFIAIIFVLFAIGFVLFFSHRIKHSQ